MEGPFTSWYPFASLLCLSFFSNLPSNYLPSAPPKLVILILLIKARLSRNLFSQFNTKHINATNTTSTTPTFTTQDGVPDFPQDRAHPNELPFPCPFNLSVVPKCPGHQACFWPSPKLQHQQRRSQEPALPQARPRPLGRTPRRAQRRLARGHKRGCRRVNDDILSSRFTTNKQTFQII